MRNKDFLNLLSFNIFKMGAAVLEYRGVCKGLVPSELLGVVCYAQLPVPTGRSPSRIKYGGLHAQEGARAVSFPKQTWFLCGRDGASRLLMLQVGM